MFRDFMAATGQLWALNTMAVCRLTGLFVDHSARLSLLQMHTSMVYLQWGSESFRGLHHLHARGTSAPESPYLQPGHGDLSSQLPAVTGHEDAAMAERLVVGTGDNVICFATALQKRTQPPS